MSTWPRDGLPRKEAGVSSSAARYCFTCLASPSNGVQEDRRVRLLQRMREELVFIVDLDPEMLAAMVDALAAEHVHEQRQRLLLDVAPRLEIDAEAVEFVLAITRAEAEGEAPVAEDVDEGGVLGDAQRIGERQRHHRGADPDALGQRREISRVDEDIRHDAVLTAEVMLGDPRGVEADLVGAQDFARHAGVHVAMRIGLDVRIGMGREENAEFHASSLLPFGWPFRPCRLYHHHTRLRPSQEKPKGGGERWASAQSASSASAGWACPWHRG